MATNGTRLIAAFAAALLLAGCQSSSLTVATLGYAPDASDTLTSPLAGNVIGRDLSNDARRTALEAEYRALEFGRTGSPIEWRGRRGVRGQVIPGPNYQINETRCRDYTHTIRKGDALPETARSTACRAADGTWEAVG